MSTVGLVVANLQALEALQSMGVVVEVDPTTFLQIASRQEKPLILKARGGIFRKHHRYLQSYKGLIFFTKCYEPLTLPQVTELIETGRIRIPFEAWKIW